MSTPYFSGAFINTTHVGPAPISAVIWQPEPLVRYPLPVAWIHIRAYASNTGVFCIGDENINATTTPRRGVWIKPDGLWKDTDCDLSKIFLHSSVANEWVGYTYGLP